MLTPTTTITGDKELDRILKDLGKNALKDSDIKRGLVKLSKPIIKDIRSNVEVGKETYDVEYGARLNIERAFNKNKTQTQEKLRKEILSLLDKKLKKLK